MKKIRTSVMLVMVAVAMMATACGKEEPKVPESKLVGIWTAPLAAGGDAVHGVGGKDMVINADHTASFAVLFFNNWKIEGDVLTLTSYSDLAGVRKVGVLQYTIENISDSTMLLKGKYTYAVGDSVYMQGDMSGLYKKKPQPQD